MIITAMGVDVVLNQADLMAHLIVEEMSLGDMMTLLKLRKGWLNWQLFLAVLSESTV